MCVMVVIYASLHIAFASIKTKRVCLRGLDLHSHRYFLKGRGLLQIFARQREKHVDESIGWR